MYVIVDTKKKKQITKPATALELTKLCNALNATAPDRYKLEFVEVSKEGKK